nr:hypothetical protein [uncultured Fluviicola sp.]
MSDLTKFSDGASILQQVDVSDIFKNLALGIAEAQQKLDDNSIAQAVKLAETKIGNESLLDLGFAPVFYAFQYADISASIYLKMALKESLEFGFGLDLQIAKNKGYSEDTHDFLSEDNYSETTEEYKASRQISFRAKEKKAVKINKTFVSQKEDLKAKSRVEKFKRDIKTQASVDQVYDEIHSRTLTENHSRGVDVWMEGGYLRIEEGLHFGVTGVGVLKIQDFGSATNYDVNNSSTTPGSFPIASFSDSFFQSVSSDTDTFVYGLTKTGDLYTLIGSNWVPVSSKMYFGYNSDEIRYNTNLKDGPTDGADFDPVNPTTAANNQNYAEHHLIHKVLRLIQNNDPGASITITGMSDPKGGTNPKNQSLAERRAEKLRDHIFGSVAPVNVKTAGTTNATGNSDLLKRYAKIELDSDYIILIGDAVTGDASTDSTVNKFVYAAHGTAESFKFIDVMYGSEHLTTTDDSAMDIIDALNIQNHQIEETSDNLHYLLDNEAIVKFSLFTNQSEEIEIEDTNESSSEGTENSTSFFSGKTKNQKSLLNDSVSSKSQDSSFALGASVDFRMSRQFEMSMEGNSSMSARLVSVSAPDNFVEYLKTVYANQSTGG